MQLRYCGLLIFSCSFDYSTGVYCRYLYLNCLYAGCTAAYVPMSTYFNQVYDDNRWWISRYDAKRAEGRTHYNALGHCAGKLVRVIWKMLTGEVEFNLE